MVDHERGNVAETGPAEAAVVPWLLEGTDSEELRVRAGTLLSSWLDDPAVQIADVAAALRREKPRGDHRAVVLGATRMQFVEGLRAIAAGESSAYVVAGRRRPTIGTVATVFCGLGSDLHGSGRLLHARFPVFARAFDRVAEELERYLPGPLREVLWDGDGALLGDTVWEHASLFALHVAQYHLLEAAGVAVDQIIGHSLGETAAAHFVGALPFEDACRLVVRRAELVDALPYPGVMTAIEATAEEMEPFVGPELSVAAVNTDRILVIAGSPAAADEATAAFRALGRWAKRLRTSHGFHSPLMDPTLGGITNLVRSIPWQAVDRSVVSSVTGGPVTGVQLSDPSYWTRNARDAVRFGESMLQAADMGVGAVVEIGVDSVLSPMIASNTTRDVLAVPLVSDSGSEERMFLAALASLHVAGTDVRWAELVPERSAVDLVLPGRPIRPNLPDSVEQPVARPVDSELLDLVLGTVRAVLGRGRDAEIDADVPFAGLGGGSLAAVELRARLNAATGLTLPVSLVFDYSSPRLLAAHLAERLTGRERASDRPAETRATAAAAEDPIVVVGMACRLPGGIAGPEDLWTVLCNEHDVVSAFPADRGWDLERLYDPELSRPGTSITEQGGFLDDVAAFDAGFFGLSAREAVTMDPQQRLALETSWAALENAGIDPRSLAGKPVGVFAGVYSSGYRDTALRSGLDVMGQVMLGSLGSLVSGRIAYTLGLEGPALSIDTACSSSLVALHDAARAIRAGECDMALAGGVTVMSEPDIFVAFSEMGGLSPDGRCRAFSDEADGTGWSEGVGFLVLERWTDARRNGHRVLAVVRGSAVNQDGASNGLTAPRAVAQERVIRAALSAAGVEPADVDAVEAHGTGTRLGDPIEAEAVFATYGTGRPADGPVALGSLKSNIGHTQAAAGVAGVIKVILAFRHELLPRSLHLDRPSSHVDWDDRKVRLLAEATPWPRGTRPRLAGVSAFGISGTNAHLILEEPPVEPSRPPNPPTAPAVALPWLLSAASAEALQDQADRLRGFLTRAPDACVDDVGLTLLRGRARGTHRAVLIDPDRDDVAAGLSALASGRPHDVVVLDRVRRAGGIAMLFAGQGTQRAGMGRQLARYEPVFKEAWDAVAKHFEPHLGRPLADLVNDDQLVVAGRTEWVQPALFALQVALARLAASYGVQPDYVLGHSAGEVAAAHIAGVLSLPDACRLVLARGRLMQELPAGGAMAAIEASEDEVTPLLGARVDLAVVNSDRSLVVSGDEDEVARIASVFSDLGRRTRRLPVSHAFHSHRMVPMLERFEEVLESIDFRAPRTPLVSCTTGRLAGEELLSTRYWCDQVRKTVRFADGVATLRTRGVTRFVEVGPDAVLSAGLDAGDDELVVSLLRGSHRAESPALTKALAELHASGVEIDWSSRVPRGARLVELPTYPFRRDRHWPRRATSESTDPGPRTARTSAWCHDVEWRPVPSGGGSRLAHGERWLVLGAGRKPMEDALRRAGAEVAGIGADHLGGAELEQVRSALGQTADARPAAGVLWLPGPAALDYLPALLRTLVRSGTPGRLWVATRGAVRISGDDLPPDPRAAMLWGAGRVAALEHPRLWGGLVDLPVPPDQVDARQLLDLMTTGHEDQIALRGETVHARRLSPMRSSNSAGWRPSGTVLITGGTGGLGAHLAVWLAENGASHVVVLSRRGPDAPGAGEVRAQVAAAGARVSVIAGDVRDRGSVAAVLRTIADQGETLRSVFHLAGTVLPRALVDLGPAEMSERAAAKAEGARVLVDLLDPASLDALVLFSSVAGVWGARDLAAYAAGNAFLDAFAERCRADGWPVTAVAWGPWEGSGMGGGEHGTVLARAGLRALSPRTALDLLPALIGRDSPTTVVADLDRATFARLFTMSRPSPLLGGLLEPDADQRPPRPASGDEPSAWSASIRLLAPDEQLAAARRVVADALTAILGTPPEERIDGDQAWPNTGLDSVGAVELQLRLCRATGLQLPTTLAFDHPGLDALAAQLVQTATRTAHDAVLSRAIDEIEHQFAALPAGSPARVSAAARLAAVADRLHPPTLGSAAASEADELADHVATADDEQLFALLEANSTTHLTARKRDEDA
ncbi:type I polyketide synthase [Micromonospora sp. CB01531]|uniref:type I polyketide synthase n=1 Tax=Micromonospora sp. CB01531 TaxID=1718947 RepID=UPI000967C315|nr:type I polyketide synthase [Micromonospora sp. CB01531]OKI44032.1 hypothetical protein A6A27_38595 [Micromonospora sp. CB01531]